MQPRYSLAITLALLIGCQTPSLGPGPIHEFEVWSVDQAETEAFASLCKRDLTGAAVVSASELFADSKAFEGRPISIVGKYILSEQRSELEVNSNHRIWIDGTFDPTRRNQRVTITGIFTTRKTAKWRLAATICGVTSIGSPR